ncbi:hypothetical protein CHU92_08840 [Flavobacterium cyanobacteriorum]|uniref:CUB domain-containing protein n=1 Tax=Flavobacterium cyanobacteriorum TaxID=2022802 RepID=A0A255Z6R7_9FLAO|nr:T9SS type A sorting domain-containing protein [Flavobacterium cyanobacteriorum]OYQ37129.1 hypothetical protein CHU92_08840 [Flavobacterium cyanobacteriorum]
MKKKFTLVLLLLALPFNAQQKIAAEVNRLIAAKIQFPEFSPLIATNGPAVPGGVVSEAQYAALNKSELNRLLVSAPPAIALELPYQGETLTILLYKAEVLAEGFHVATDSEDSVPYEKGLHYRGIIKGDEVSIASFNFFRGEFNGIVSSKRLNNLVTGRLLEEGNTNRYILYSDANVTLPLQFKCNAPEPGTHFGTQWNRQPDNVQSNRCVTVYFEMDHDLYLQNGSSVANTTNWMTSVFNNVQTLFANDGITTAIKSTFIWTTPDPYEGESSFDYLGQFHVQRPVFDGDVGQLVGIDPEGLGGVAVTIAGLCSPFNFSYSDVELGFSTVPAYSWTVQVIIHELGHLFGSPHTHGCYWNGNNTAIDGCGSSAGFPEGNCPQGPIPPTLLGGTIMSYCHLVPGVGINFANGFGIQPAQRMLNHVESSGCLSTDCINTCINGVAGFTITNGINTTTVTWTDVSNTGPWEVSFAPFNEAFTSWQQVNTNSYTATGLTPNVYYKIGIRPVCSSGAIAPVQELTFAASGNACDGITFTDTGGLAGNYSNEQYLQRTFSPNAPNSLVVVTFSSFNIEEDFDFMYVYNGADTTAPLIGVFTGNVNPGTILSSAADGSLTFVFRSDIGLTLSGWDASVTCIFPLSTEDNIIAGFSYYPNPTGSTVNITSAEELTSLSVYNVTGQLLLQKDVAGLHASADLSSFADGIYIVAVKAGNSQETFRIIKNSGF